MNTTTLELFIDVCEYSSISKAAAANFLTRQSLAKTMDRLEAEVGAKLFVRTHTGVAPTVAGKLLLEDARRQTGSWKRTLSRIRAAETDAKTLRLGCQMAMVSDETLEALLFSGTMPGLVNLVFLNVPKTKCWNMMHKGKLDLSYTLAPRNDERIEEVPLTCPFSGPYLLMNTENPLVDADEIRAESFKGQTTLVLNDPGSSNSHLLEYLNRARARVLFMPSTNSFLRGLVARGEGVLVVPGSAVLQFRDPRIVAKPIADFPPIMWQSLLRPRGCTAEVLEVAEAVARVLESQYATFPYRVSLEGTVSFPA